VVAATLAVSVKSVVRVAAATPVLCRVAVPQVRAMTARLAVLLAAVGVATPKPAALTGLVKAATVPSIGGSRRPLLAMRAAEVQATTTPGFARSVASMAVATAATTPTTPSKEPLTRVVERAVVIQLVFRIPVVTAVQASA
tara:strand:- start:68 stop:490 length:423 start_codon:yes stop_codon:yes gene_type:complete